jgi:hypothetical protein
MGVKSQVEIEAKFAVSPDNHVPDLTHISYVTNVLHQQTHNLSATYYDTTDLRLTRAKITLRRRVGGKDDGWHIKLPADYGRKEIHHDLTESEQVPPAVIAPIGVLVRGASLVPIAQVDNQRHESILGDEYGVAIAEFCDDHVTAQSFLPGGGTTTWREWEIEVTETAQEHELTEKIIATATELFHAAGAVTSTSPSKLVMALGASINNVPLPTELKLPDPESPGYAVITALKRNRDKIIAYDSKVRNDEWDSVHQMRVATRELRSHLDTFDGIITSPHCQPLSAQLKQLATILGVARDAEVIAERFQLLADSVETGAVTKEDGDRLYASMRDEYRLAHQRILKALDDPRYFAMLNLLDEVLRKPEIKAPSADNAPSQAILLDHLTEAYQRLYKRHKKAVKCWADAELPLHQRENYFHDLRKAAKKLRYAAEAVGDATEIDTGQLYKACKQMQTVLGDFQDSVTSRDKLYRKAEQARKAGEDTFIYGVLYQLEHHIGQEILEGYQDTAHSVIEAYQQLQKMQQEKAKAKKKRKKNSTKKKK